MTQKMDQYVQLQGDMVTEGVSLHQAFGGGWQIRFAKDCISTPVEEKMKESIGNIYFKILL